MGRYLWMGDIVHMGTDAVVNAARTDLARAPGICEAIFAAADGEKLEQACRRLGRCPIGQAVLTPSFGLPAPHIIHVAGPDWFGGLERERMLLADCYRRAMSLALVQGFGSIAIPLMFSGEYHIPRKEAIGIAGASICAFTDRHPELDVVLVVYRPGILTMARRLLGWEESGAYDTSAPG